MISGDTAELWPDLGVCRLGSGCCPGPDQTTPAGTGNGIGVGKGRRSDGIEQAGLRWCPGFG